MCACVRVDERQKERQEAAWLSPMCVLKEHPGFIFLDFFFQVIGSFSMMRFLHIVD